MRPSPQIRPPLSVAVWFVLALAAYAMVLLALPLPAWMARAQAASGTLAWAATHKKIVVLGVGALAVAVLAAILLRRRFDLLRGCVALGVLVVVTAGIYSLQKQYPLARFYSSERYQDMFAVLLGRDLVMSRYAPESSLKVERRPIERARFPVIDAHFHLESLPYDVSPRRLVEAMDAVGVAQLVNLGGNQGAFEHFAKKFRDAYPGRFILFVKPDADALTRPDGVASELAWLKRAVRMGAQGIKENKSYGLGQRDQSGRLVPVDDPRLDPYWELAGQLGLPVLVHTGEPSAFWKPVDHSNERYSELIQDPSWSLYGTDAPSQQELMAQRERLLARHPRTIFIGAHLGMNADDLAYAASLLDRFPNYYVDMSTVVSDLGRQPNTARRFFIKYQDRILFGSDGGFKLRPKDGWTPERMWRSYFEFLETDNEYIDYPLQSITKQGNWKVSGLNLPPEVLEKVYSLNAQRLIPSSRDVIARLEALEPTK